MIFMIIFWIFTLIKGRPKSLCNVMLIELLCISIVSMFIAILGNTKEGNTTLPLGTIFVIF